ncbi:transporter substrate-binding domain-containing protein [Paraburkholderia phosphatilytica]|uniref:transporter substrate-binding domain-containing protein n=1 Tax=Paraburkholderia phosphatilytica TaxID=2282883 RepID=UPI000E5467A4|nr:transporter substrate-binding domain-containing protein [Paraburkholderia phosphatilytica]
MHLAVRRPLAGLTLLAAAVLCAPFAAHAQDLTGTLKKIHDDRVVLLGVREASIPFAYSNGQHTVGYSYAIAQRIIDEIRKTLNLPDLKVREVPVNSSNRVSLLVNNQIDLECGSTTHTRDRENQAAFSYSFFMYSVRMLVRKSSHIKDFQDLAGKPVVTTAGTSDERLLRELNSAKQLNMRIAAVKDHPEAFAMVKSGRAVAFVMDEPILYGTRAADPHPDEFEVTGSPLATEAYACMFRKGDAPFRKLVNDVVGTMETSGEAARLYDTWFTQPIPPHGTNLNYPLSPQMRDMFAHPNDRALD